MFKQGFGWKFKWQRVMVVVAIGMWLISATKIISDGITGKENVGMVDTFSENVKDTKSVDIQIFGKIKSLDTLETNNSYVLESAKRAILIDTAKRLGINRYDITTNDSDAMELNQKSANGNVRAVLSKMEGAYYLTVDVSLLKSLECVDSYREIIKDIARDNGIEEVESVNIVGQAKGDVSISEKNALTSNILRGLKAKEVSGNKNSEVYSVYAYSKAIDDYIRVGKNKINVNITMNYDEENDVTNIYMSTPIYNGDY